MQQRFEHENTLKNDMMIPNFILPFESLCGPLRRDKTSGVNGSREKKTATTNRSARYLSKLMFPPVTVPSLAPKSDLGLKGVAKQVSVAWDSQYE